MLNWGRNSMLSRINLVPLLVVATLSGCAHGGLMPTSEHRSFASAAFEYALLAHNSYGDRSSWVNLPPDVALVVECDNDDIGLAYSIFERTSSGVPEQVFTFRGTEGFGADRKKDWKYGNLSYAQQRRSEPIIAGFSTSHPSSDIVFVGHSLGGALAIHNSMRVQGKRVYASNSSPRFYAPPEYEPEGNPSQRLSIVEKGEVPKATRIFSREAWQTYMPFNCFGKGDPVTQHEMLRLAVCLTRIAASEGGTSASLRARQYLDLNPWMLDATEHPPIAAVWPLESCPR